MSSQQGVKVVLIGVGSASFGRGAIADLMHSKELNDIDLTVTLVDIDEVALDRMYRFAEFLKEHCGANAKIEATTNRQEALPDADYVITAVARRRYQLWEQDFLVPFAFGFQQVFGENGGPGAAFHALRSFHLMIPICRDMEEICPQALLINYSNPESRICMAVSKLTHIRAVGLCHGAFGTLDVVARILGKSKEAIDITIGGINHFHWVLDICDRADGQDLYPLFHQRMAESDWGLDLLTRRMYEVFGLLPFPAASHIGEYVSFAYEICGPIWIHRKSKIPLQEKTEAGTFQAEKIQRVVEGRAPLTEELTRQSGELAVPIICDIEFDRNKRELSVNIPNDNHAVSNLPEDAIVEIPARVDAQGVHPIPVGSLPEAIAAMCRKQISIQKLLVEAYRERSKKLLLQALLIDPIVDSIERAEKMVEELLRIEADFLPTFQ